MGMKSVFRGIRDSYVRFAEKQGFAIIAVICVGVITATAVWTDHRADSYVAPTPPVMEDVSAAQLQQQWLRDAATISPSPTETPHVWLCPLENAAVLRAYDQQTMVQGDQTGIWAIHDAVDLGAALGSKVRAMADGEVLDAGNDRLHGVWLLIDHGNGTEALYAGMALNAAYQPGDAVLAGDTIGFVGDGLLDECSLEPHLHLRITQDGASIDPSMLWESFLQLK